MCSVVPDPWLDVAADALRFATKLPRRIDLARRTAIAPQQVQVLSRTINSKPKSCCGVATGLPSSRASRA